MRDQVEDETPAPVHSPCCPRKLIDWICIHIVGRHFRPESTREIEITSTFTQELYAAWRAFYVYQLVDFSNY